MQLRPFKDFLLRSDLKEIISFNPENRELFFFAEFGKY